MAQDFERNFLTGVGVTPLDIPDGSNFDSDDTIIGIHMANTNANSITASCFMTSSAFTGNTGDPYAIAVTVVSNQYLLDGATRPALTLHKGFTYVFTYPAGHPFALSTTSDGTHGSGGSEYTTGVTRDSSANTLTVVVSDSTPATLYYYCSNHSNHGGQITVTNVHYIIKDAPIPGGSSLQLLDGGAKMVVQNGDRMFFQSSTASSLDVWVSRVDSIST